ncbi:MAG: segregation/condensation protein A, partial [Nanoarchaeota archaeon]|nr:segregation/condensation protein A [Nanoarchaeota archaeon]
KDISEVIREMYIKIKTFFTTNNTRLTFSTLVPSETKEDKIYTFIPLLHLTNQRKIDIEQYQPFGEIEIILRQKIELDKELNSGIEA